MNTRTTLPIVMFAERGYRVLLRLYPADHRAEYGHWMAQAFRDQCYEAVQKQGKLGLVEVWVLTVFDTLITALQERKPIMLKSFPIRAPWIVLLGGMLILVGAAGMVPNFAVAVRERWRYKALIDAGALLMIPVLFCMTFTVWHLWQRVGSAVPAWGRYSLVLSSLCGAITAILGTIMQVTRGLDGLWNVLIVIWLLHFFLLAAFGLGNVQWRALPGANLAPLVIGVTFPLMALIDLRLLGRPLSQRAIDMQQVITFICYVIIGLGMIWLAFGLMRERQPRLQGT